MSMTATEAPKTTTGRLALSEKYRRDHQNPINHVLHVYVGWPLCALGVISLLMLRLWWFVGFFAAGYAFMWAGHFLFEKNLPTIFKHPTTPFVMAWTVIKSLVGGAARLVGLSRAR